MTGRGSAAIYPQAPVWVWYAAVRADRLWHRVRHGEQVVAVSRWINERTLSAALGLVVFGSIALMS